MNVVCPRCNRRVRTYFPGGGAVEVFTYHKATESGMGDFCGGSRHEVPYIACARCSRNPSGATTRAGAAIAQDTL